LAILLLTKVNRFTHGAHASGGNNQLNGVIC